MEDASASLFINLDWFDSKDSKNFKAIIFDLFFKFKKLTNGCKATDEIWRRLFNKKDNTKFFYEGLENDANDICQKKHLQIFNYFKNNKNLILDFKNPHFTKTKIPSTKGMGFRVFSIVYLQMSIIQIPATEINLNETIQKGEVVKSPLIFYMFPIKWENYHE